MKDSLSGSNRFYFDWAATSPCSIKKTFDDTQFYGNPSSRHTEGKVARSVLEDARRRAAAVLGVDAGNIYFTSGATESNAIVLFSTLYNHASGIKQTVLTTMAEHPSIIKNCDFLERLGVPVHLIDIDQYGGVTSGTLEKAVRKRTGATLLALMYVNNETGAVSDLPNLVKTARGLNDKTLHIHSDMVQAIGKLPFALRDLDIDSASFSAHKIGGPRGIGILYLRKNIQPLYRGGGQEGGMRPGTENTQGAFYFSEVLSERSRTVTENYEDAVNKMSCLIKTLRGIERCSIIPECRQDVDTRFSPYILQVAFKNIPGEVMMRALDDAGFAVSTGSACSSASKKRTVLNAMGINDKLAFTAIRISTGQDTSLDDIDALTGAINHILKQL
ncbi:MAG: cysteine desulfurase [Treponema sp.]|nr:cysteine desulfurase [Treponema sp.]